MGTLKDQIILVTGAAGAVGSATVRAIVESGGRAIAVDTNARSLQKLFVDESSVEPATLDVASEEGWATLGTAISDSWGGLDGLVTCAAVLHPDDGSLGSLTREVWDQTQAINATGAMLASQAAVVLMRNRGGGSIVHVSSITATRGSLTAQMAYTASKGALNALSREMAVAYAPDAIRVNTISPGLLDTALTSELVAAPRELARRLAHIPLGRLGLPSDVAEAAIWLLSDASTYVTGADLVIDGGLSAAFVTGRE
jgi:NAD(P)-dependent dehydrogenase (short-subunit alcohol dehydrogenase family)